MATSETHVVTGAFSFSGKYIARRLLSIGKQVRTLTRRPDRPNPFGDQVSVAPLDFDHPDELVASLRGADVLYNTYWIRFPRGDLTFEKAVENTKVLIRAAEEAGVRRVVHISVTNASETSPLPYFRGKGLVERAVRDSRLSYAIVRPALVFGVEDVLINNIAWMLRRFPVFAVFGSGEYRLQPIFAEDLAQIAVNAGSEGDNVVMDAIGPETFTFNELVGMIADKVGTRARIIHTPRGVAVLLSRLLGYVLGDVVLTEDEVDGLMSDLLVTDGVPVGRTRLSGWLEENADQVGRQYASELKRHYRGNSL